MKVLRVWNDMRVSNNDIIFILGWTNHLNLFYKNNNVITLLNMWPMTTKAVIRVIFFKIEIYE